MEDLMKEQLHEIESNPERIWHDCISNGADVSAFDLETFQPLYESILHMVSQVKLLDLWASSFSISHPDLTINNILVSYDDPTHIVGIIDWEGTRIQPWVSP
jgi:hypothetical protein